MIVRSLLAVMMIFATSRSEAQFARVVRPPEIPSLFSFIEFEMQTALEQFYKEGVSLVRESPTSIRLRTSICGEFDSSPTDARVHIRRHVDQTKERTLITEEVLIQRCGTTAVIARIVRRGASILPTLDALLLRGHLPSAEGADSFDLFLSDSSVAINRVRSAGRETLYIKIGPDASDNQFLRLEISEAKDADGSERSSLKIRAFGAYRNVTEASLDYVWRARSGGLEVPRQYIYLDGNEIGPEVYLSYLATYLSRGVYEWIGPAFKRALGGVD